MIGNTSSQHKEPDDVDLDFYVKQNKKGGEKTKMDNNQQTSTVVQPSANPSTGFSATAPDPDGEIASQKYEKPVMQKAIDALEEAMQSLEDIYLEKSEYPNVSRPTAPATVSGETCPNCGSSMTKAEEPHADRASSVNVSNETKPEDGEPSSIAKAIQKAKDALDAVNAELVGKDKYENQNHSTPAPSTEETTQVEKAANCCDNACGNCKGPGCGCCDECKGIAKADDADSDDNIDKVADEEEDSKSMQKSVWGGSFLPI